MFVWVDKDVVALVHSKILLDNLAFLVIHDIKLNFVSPQFQEFELLFVHGKDGLVGEIGNG